ncbi:MAG: GTPase [Anaerolineaceae bacterium 4572_78]|nr:MAG: GTPase [Anaerolineaceae bacterium 4572_78]
MDKQEKSSSIVRSHVIYSMGAGLVPIPFADIAAVTAIQIDMLTQLATHYDVKLSVIDLPTIISALTGSSLAKIGSSFVKAIPGIGPVVGGLSMSILSGASTYAVAQVAINQFAVGKDFSDMDMGSAKRMYNDAFEQGKQYAFNLEHENKDQEKPKKEDIFAKLEKLGELRDKELITDDEFKLQKQKLLERL